MQLPLYCSEGVVHRILSLIFNTAITLLSLNTKQGEHQKRRVHEVRCLLFV